MQIETERLILREFSIDDWPELLAPGPTRVTSAFTP